MTRVLIIEDEIKTARELKEMLLHLRSDISVVDIIPTVKGGIHWLGNNEMPDIIFSDIQLADGLSFSIFKKVPVKAPIVFCTAYDDYAIRSFETNGIDYLLKPIDESRLLMSLEKYEKLKVFFGTQQNNVETRLNRALELMTPRYRSSLLIHSQGKVIPLKTEAIAFILYDSGTIAIHTNEQKRYFMNSTMDELEGQLDPAVFYRANRQYIVNRGSIELVEHFFSRKLLVKLKPPATDKIIVSKLKARDFLNWLDNRP